jgi:tRNA A-37 threonylcarbamoyl transferase component Bud32
MASLWGMMTLPTTATHVAVAMVTMVVALLVLAADRRQNWNQWLAFFLLLVSANFAATALDAWFFLGEQDGTYALGSTRDLASTVRSLGFLFVIFDPAVLAYFASIFPRRSVLAERWWGLALLGAPVLFLVALEVTTRTLSHPVLPSGARAIFAGYLAACYVYAGFRLLRSFLEERSTVMARQVGYVTAGVLVVAFPRVALVARDVGISAEGWVALAEVAFRLAVVGGLLGLAFLATKRRVASPARAAEAQRLLRTVGVVCAAFGLLWVLDGVVRAASTSGATLPAGLPEVASFLQVGLTFSSRWFVFSGAILVGFVQYRLLAVGGRALHVGGFLVAAVLGAMIVGVGAALFGPWWGGAIAGGIVGGVAAVAWLRSIDSAEPAGLVASAHVRQIELYRHLLGTALASDGAGAARGEELADARRRLGIREEEHEALLAVAQAEELGVPRERVVLGRFEVLRRIGSGASATVYLARDLRAQRLVVLKRLQAEVRDDGALQAALRELDVARRVSHPHVIAIHDVVGLDDGALIVMEHAAGGSLRDLLARGERPPPERIARILREVLGALAALHGAGLVHGDLKPENVLLTDAGDVRLADFGIAHTAPGGGRTRLDVHAAALGGTPAYMDPEQLRGEPSTPASDLYAAGVLACELLTGRTPTLSAQGSAIPPTLVPEHWRGFLRTSLAPRGQRFATAGAMAAALPRGRGGATPAARTDFREPLRARSP